MLHQSCITFASILTYGLIKRFYCREFCRGEFIEYHYQNVHRTKNRRRVFSRAACQNQLDYLEKPALQRGKNAKHSAKRACPLFYPTSVNKVKYHTVSALPSRKYIITGILSIFVNFVVYDVCVPLSSRVIFRVYPSS